MATLEKENAQELLFPEDFKKANALTNAQVQLLLENLKTKRDGLEDKEGIQLPRAFLGTLEYCQKFNRYKNKEAIRQVRGLLESKGLHWFEAVSLANLCPESSDEAKTLLPSLQRFVEEDGENELQELLNELTKFQKFQ
eukprot:Colp12_sorted_trinity150504_noHs@34932